MTNQELIQKFYQAFQQRDWQSMHACYHPDVTFEDPVFGKLDGKKARAMWHMLVSNARDLEITCSQISASGDKGKCHWEAIYNFSKTGRRVHNKIDAEFQFKDNLIIDHRDHFDLWKWSGMALGWTGKLLGWTPMVTNKIRENAGNSLEKFIAQNVKYQ